MSQVTKRALEASLKSLLLQLGLRIYQVRKIREEGNGQP